MLTLLYRNTRLLILILILIVVWGLSSYQTLPRLEDPELVSRTALVTTFFPGASAERVEALVTEKIEDQLADITEIQTYESTSQAGSSIITIELRETLTLDDVDGVWSRVRDKINAVVPALPTGATAPELDEVEVKAYALIVALAWQQPVEPNYAILRRLSLQLKDSLQALGGTEQVDQFGEPDEEITVNIDAPTLASLGLTVPDLTRQLQQSDAKAAAGQLRGSTTVLPLQIENDISSLERLRQTPIRLGGSGAIAYLGDVAQVAKGTAMPLSDLAIASGQPAIALGVFVRSNDRLDQWANAAHRTLDEFRQQLPAGVELQVLFDQSRYVSARLRGLLLNLLGGAVLVFGVTLAMMGWRSAVIVGASLPLSLLLVLGCMGLLAIPLHQISVTGLIVALGILIDTAIVMVDEVQEHLTHGLAPEAAIARSVGHLAVPLLGSTLTTVLAFMPIALLPGSVGEFVGTIGINVILAVSCSLVLGLTVIPTLAARLHQQFPPPASVAQPQQQRSPVTQILGQILGQIQTLHHRLLTFVLRRPVWGIGLALALPLVGFLQAPGMEQQFFPAADRDQLQIQLELPASAPIAQTEAAVLRLRDRLLQHPQVDDVYWFVGQNAPRFYYNLSGGRDNEASFAQALVQLNTLASSDLTQTLQAEAEAIVPNARLVVRQLEQGPPFDAPIEMRIYGASLEQLQTLGTTVRTELVQVDGITHTRASLDDVRPQLSLQLNEADVRLAGLDYGRITQQLEGGLEGAVGGSLLESTEDLPVRVRLSETDRHDLGQVAAQGLITASGDGPSRWVPLSTLGSVALTPTQAKITRRNGLRVNIVQGFIQAGTLPSVLLERWQQRLAARGIQPPAGYRFEVGGEAEERSSAIGNLVATVGVLTVLMVATLVLSLGSFRLAGLIGSVAIASFGLGLFSVWLFGYPFGFNPIIGTVGLVGVAINDSIVVLAALQENAAARLGDRHAISAVVLRASRHVVTTTLTTMIGFAPLLLSGGDFWPPLAVAIAGGVGGATLLALYFIPAAFLLLNRHRHQALEALQRAPETWSQASR